MSYGFAGYIGIGKVTASSGLTAAQTTTDYIKALSEAINLDYDRFQTTNIHGNYYEPDDEAGMGRVSGNIVVPVHPVSFGHILMGTFNRSTVTTVLSGFLWKSVFTTVSSDAASDSAGQPFCFEVNRDSSSSFRYAGINITTLEINYAPNQDVRATVGVVGRNASSVTKTTPTFPSSSSSPFTFDTLSLSTGGTGTTKIEALRISIDNQIEGLATLGNNTNIIRTIRRGPQTIRLAGTMNFTSFTDYNNFVNQTEQEWIVSVFKASSFQLDITLPRVVLNTFPINMSGRERISVNFTGMARYHTGSGTAINIALTTTKSDY